MKHRTTLLGLLSAFTLLFVSCSGDYDRVEITGCDLNKFEEEMERSVTLPHLSMYLIKRIRNNQSTDEITVCIAYFSPEILNSSLDTERKKKAFWLNV
ncbi:MAG: hypothetical protein R3220_10590 [Balneolaceae bacterium]|nr:hypothetical protein [Balneolaceae bacterium]